MRIEYQNDQDRTKIIEQLAAIRQQDSSFTVVDVGGAASPWSVDVADLILDRCDLNFNSENDWQRLCTPDDLFNYAICSHTLEDLAYPQATLKYLPRIAHAGVIIVPSAYREMSRFEGLYKGYIHHRWIIVPNDFGELLFLPKIPATEYMETTLPESLELRIYWEKSIDWTVINDDYLGPNPGAVLDMYMRTLNPTR
ncbi:MAG: hypothetical protein PHQ40_20280 [Anaerolineaceae bacterium]|nr:hypothetical protein [Anaerolineaceae bacterium]